MVVGTGECIESRSGSLVWAGSDDDDEGEKVLLTAEVVESGTLRWERDEDEGESCVRMSV